MICADVSKLKDTLSFKLVMSTIPDSINMELADINKRYSSTLLRSSSNNYLVKQKFDVASDHDLIIYINKRAVLAYRLRVIEWF